MRKLLTKVRAYGWYCPHCKTHKNIENVNVVKVVKDRYMTMICADCTTKVVDCFLIKADKLCDECPDRFRCFTRSDIVVEKVLQSVKSHEILGFPDAIDTRNIEGVRSYTGIYYDKLERNDNFCAYAERDDCNFSWMRQNYKGEPYKRCHYMKYHVQDKVWYCYFGKSKRGEI